MIWQLKHFHIINIGTKSILHSLYNLTNFIYAATDNINNKKLVNSHKHKQSVIFLFFYQIFSEILKYCQIKKRKKAGILNKTTLTQTPWESSGNIPDYHFAEGQIILWKLNIQTLK